MKLLIKEKLQDKRISMHHLALKTGVSSAYLSELLSGKYSNPGIDVLIKIAKYFKCKVDDLIDNEDIQTHVATEEYKNIIEFKTKSRVITRRSEYIKSLRRLSDLYCYISDLEYELIDYSNLLSFGEVELINEKIKRFKFERDSLSNLIDSYENEYEDKSTEHLFSQVR